MVVSYCSAAGHGALTGQTDPTTKMPVPATCPAGSMVSGLDTGVTGTSAATPMWAGVVALINQKAQALGKRPVGVHEPRHLCDRQGSHPVRERLQRHPGRQCNQPLWSQLQHRRWIRSDDGLGDASVRRHRVDHRGDPGGHRGCLDHRTRGSFDLPQRSEVHGRWNRDHRLPGCPGVGGLDQPVQTVTSTQVVGADGTFFESDNEIQTIANYLSAGGVGCPGNPTVAVRVTDNTSGGIATTTLPSDIFCHTKLSNPFQVSPGCWIPPATPAALLERGRHCARICLVWSEPL